MEKIKLTRTTNPRPRPNQDVLSFGKYFSDHMFLLDYDEGVGWHDPRIIPYGPFTLDPSCMVFHYAQEIFEGLKAYRDPQGAVRLFRPIENVWRMNRSAARMGMPQVPEDIALAGIRELVTLDADWVPSKPDTSLYIRPFIFATEPSLGVHASKSYYYCIITSPVGSYYPNGIDPIKILIEEEDVRAVHGGTGMVKCGGNYAASIRATSRAENEGYTQVLWLDGVTRKYIEEVGSMNIMFKIAGEVVTPALTGSVLPGITRKSCIELMEAWGINVTERPITIDELLAAAADGTLEEVWGTGTAAVVSPVGEITYGGKSYVVNGGGIGPLTQRLYDELTGIQWGKTDDPFGWSIVV